MTSTSVAQHATQPLNFGPEWLRALSTPDSATSIPSSGGSGNVFKFSATKYRYSKDEILSLRANVSDRLTEATQNEILENLRDVESVFRPTIVDPVALTAPTSEETAKMNALSSYISGRTPGGAGRTGSSSQQSQQDSRNNRGGSSGSMANGRGGSRGRGGRDNSFGLSRGNSNNNNSDDNGENGNTGDETSLSSSSWSRGSYHSRGGSFGSRGRSYDDRDQPQTSRRGIGTRQTSDGWRRSRGDDDDSHEQSEDSPTPVNGSASWASRGGQTRRGGSSSSGSMEQRTKSNEKWSYNDDRPGPSNSYESNQQRGGGGWRTNSSVSDRDLSSRRPQTKRDRMPEWMDDDNNEDDHPLNNATFEKDGTFTRSAPVRDNNSNEEEKIQSRSASDESLSQKSNTTPSRQEEESKPEKSISQTDTTIVHAPTVSKPIDSQPTPPVQHSFPSWDDEFDHHDLATNVVEATLAEDPDYSPRIATHSTSRLVSLEPTPPTAPIIPQQRAPVIIDDKQWFYKDPQNTVQGPFSSADMERWFAAGYFTILLPVKRLGEAQFSTIQQLTKELGRLPFRTDVASLPPTPVQKQQPIIPETQKFSPMNYMTSSTSNNTFIDDFLMQQQQSRQNPQHSMLYNKQTSMPSSTNDRKQVSSPTNISPQLQAYFNSHSQSSSTLFPSNSVNDPAILYQQQLQRSMSSTNQQPSSSILYDDIPRSFRQLSSQSIPANNSSFFPANLAMSQQQQQQQSNDIMSRLSQAMQTHGKQQQQQDKVDDQQRRDQQRRERELERSKLIQQAERLRLQREEEERRKFEQQELRRKQEAANNRQINFDQLTKTIDTKNQSTIDTDQFLLFQQSVQFQKEQQAQLEAQQAENVRRYQQLYREQPQQSMYKLPETSNWTRHLSQTNDIAQSLNFAQIQKQEQEQERRSREAAAFAQQYTKSRSAMNQQSTPWNGGTNLSNTSLHDIQRQQTQNEVRQQHQQQSHQITSGHSSTSTPAWGSQFQQPASSQQPTSSLYWDNPQSSSASNKSFTSTSNTPSTQWTELKPTVPSTITATKINSVNPEPTKSEREVQGLFTTARSQAALSKWTETQFKDNLRDIDVPTLVQLLKDIDNAGEIMEYVQPYIGSVSKAKEFAHDFLIKRNRITNAEPDLDNERLNELAMAPTSSNDNSGSGGDEGFQLASSNGQKKKAKKIKGQKVDVKQLGFMLNNRPEQREDIEKVPM